MWVKDCNGALVNLARAVGVSVTSHADERKARVRVRFEPKEKDPITIWTADWEECRGVSTAILIALGTGALAFDLTQFVAGVRAEQAHRAENPPPDTEPPPDAN